MNELKLQAVVLSSFDYKEKDKIIKLFSLEQGIISAVLKGVRGENAKLKFAAQPFCFGNFILLKKGEFYVVTSAEMQESFFDLTKDINAYYMAFSLLEIVQVSLMEEGANPLVFVNLLKALNQICYEKIAPKLVVIKFLLGMLKVLGYRLNFLTCAACKMPFVNKKFLNLETGALVCGSCVTISCVQLTNASFTLLSSLYKVEMDKLNTIHMSEEVLTETLNILVKNFESRTERKLKTIKQFN